MLALAGLAAQLSKHCCKPYEQFAAQPLGLAVVPALNHRTAGFAAAL